MIDILFLCHNRLAFTQASLAAMIANTAWDKVSRLIIYDDNSTDGTPEYLSSLSFPVDAEIRETEFGSPVAIMNDYLRDKPSAMFAKVDNDTMLPPYWLTECLKVMSANPTLDLLGIEAMNKVKAGEVDRGYTDARYIGGIGLMRSHCFHSLPTPDGRFGFTAWQQKHKNVKKGWIDPSIPVFLLDRMPTEPWTTLSTLYIEKGWQRRWPSYGIKDNLWSWWS